MLYKYTTLESLALILKSKNIRLNPLTGMDDLQESKTADEINFGKFVFISSWMNQPLESIAMWKLYSNMQSGVRISLRRNPFRKYIVNKQDLQRLIPGAELEGEKLEFIMPLEECFAENHFLINFNYNKLLEKVEYTDKPEQLNPQILDFGKEQLILKSGELGKYKNTYWEFQNEERYILRFIPTNINEIESSSNAAQLVCDSLVKTKEFLPYCDLEIEDDAYYSMEVTLAPQFSCGNRILLDALIQQYNPDMKIIESALKDRVKL